jgi:hypothetical protein
MHAAGIRRRCVLVVAASAAVLVTSACSARGPVRSPANGPPGEVQLPDRQDRVEATSNGSLRTVSLRRFTQYAVQQQDVDACWAACAEMIGRYNDVPLTQREIAGRVRGRAEAEIAAANLYEVMQALNPDLAPFSPFEQLWARVVDRVIADPQGMWDRNWSWKDLFNEGSKQLPSRDIEVAELLRGHPVVLAKRPSGSEIGHVVVVFGVDYREPRSSSDSWIGQLRDRIRNALPDKLTDELRPSEYEVIAVSYIDPADAGVYRRPWREIHKEVEFALSASQARRRLLGWLDLLTEGRQ